MLRDQYEKLAEAANNNAYMSIAVNLDGTPVFGGSVPWERTVSAFNMRTPKVALTEADLNDGAVVDALRSCRLTGCYIYAPLSDYGFISGLGLLEDLYIRRGENVRDLSFLCGLRNLFMFYLEDASLPDLRPLIDACGLGSSLPGKCFGFRNCSVADTSALGDIRFVLSELLVWPAEGDSPERWNTAVRPGVFRYYGR